MAVTLGGQQRERDAEVDQAGDDSEVVERDERAADDSAGLMGVRQSRESRFGNEAEEDKAADPCGDGDETKNAKDSGHDEAGFQIFRA